MKINEFCIDFPKMIFACSSQYPAVRPVADDSEIEYCDDLIKSKSKRIISAKAILINKPKVKIRGDSSSRPYKVIYPVSF